MVKAAVRDGLIALLGQRGFLRLRDTIHPGWTGVRRRLAGRPPVSLGADVDPDGVVELWEPGAEIWFGYYDVTPFDRAQARLLAMRLPVTTRARPCRDGALALGYFRLDCHGGEFVAFDKTDTWCWQQGCRLQWLTDGSDGRVAYNRRIDGRHGAVIRDLDGDGPEGRYTRPIYALSPNGQWAISLNFSRLQRLRPGYGYDPDDDQTAGDLCPAGDGLWHIDLESGAQTLILTVADAAALAPEPTMGGAEHYLNHVMINPASNRMMFFHVWVSGSRRHTRLLSCAAGGKDRRVVIDTGTVSHCCWRSEDALLAYVVDEGGRSGYRLYRDGTGDPEAVGDGVLRGDGHPSYSPSRGTVLTDTYPDVYQERHLIVYDPATSRPRELGRFFSPPRLRGERRCDLHPRWSPNGRLIAVDSAHRGHRGLYVIPALAGSPR